MLRRPTVDLDASQNLENLENQSKTWKKPGKTWKMQAKLYISMDSLTSLVLSWLRMETS